MSDQPHEHDSVTLSESTLEQIYTELERRYDGFILGIERFAKETNEQVETQFFFQGGMMRAIGMAKALEAQMIRDWLNQTKDDA